MAAAFLTNSGRTKLLNASPENPVKVLHMAVGSGTGTRYPSMNALFNEAARIEVPNPLRDVNYPTVLKFTGVIPTTVGGFLITEIGLFDSAGVLLAYQLLEQPISKPSAGGPLAVTLEVVMALQLDNATQTTLIVTESNEYQHNQMTKRDAANCHPIVAITGLRTELDGFNSEIGRDRSYKKVTANYTVLPTDGGVIEVDASAGNVVITMGKSTAHIAKNISIVRTDTSANTLTINPASGDSFMGDGFVWPYAKVRPNELFMFKAAINYWTGIRSPSTGVTKDDNSGNYFLIYQGAQVSRLLLESDTVNNLTSLSESMPLAATQGRILENRDIGINQTWKNVTGNRVNGTTYTNTSTRPIQICISCDDTNGGNPYIIVKVNGVIIINYRYDAGQGFGYGFASFIVPPSNTYSVEITNGYNFSVWSELS